MKKSFYEFSNQKFEKNKNTEKQDFKNFRPTHDAQNSQSFEKRNHENSHSENFRQSEQDSDFESKKSEIEETINKYQDMSQSELLSNLFSEVNKQKQQGTFDIEKIENAISGLGAYLTTEQQNNMREMLKKFK
ncbi:MAG: hypothetical protein PHH71_03200 [Clostridia bacterium]|jgi:hypothetical protein|nr:hypothetical protein [Clostridia bacterium]MDD3232297.1 hypothetical protein [Clostridia bacterium]MDD3862507.1 hypothetical protein [Clostridia bacterium]MDD4408809.1 hypothetical protein [Clostridia bacterium]